MNNDFLPLASYLKDRFESFASTGLLNNAAGYSGTLASMKRNLERQAEELSKIANSFETISENRKLPENTVTLLSDKKEQARNLRDEIINLSTVVEGLFIRENLVFTDFDSQQLNGFRQIEGKSFDELTNEDRNFIFTTFALFTGDANAENEVPGAREAYNRDVIPQIAPRIEALKKIQ